MAVKTSFAYVPRSSPTALSQDYMRCLQAPLCAETRMLPDLDSLRDRMSLLAYDSGLMSGADSKVALLGAQALDVSLCTSCQLVLGI